MRGATVEKEPVKSGSQDTTGTLCLNILFESLWQKETPGR